MVCCVTELHWPVSHPSQKSHCSWFQGFQTARGNWSLQHGSPSVLSGHWSFPAETRMRTIRKQRGQMNLLFTVSALQNSQLSQIEANRLYQLNFLWYRKIIKQLRLLNSEWSCNSAKLQASPVSFLLRSCRLFFSKMCKRNHVRLQFSSSETKRNIWCELCLCCSLCPTWAFNVTLQMKTASWQPWKKNSIISLK